MGGVIGVDSAAGRGSIFWLEIPFPRSTAIPAPAALARRVVDALVLEPHDASAEALLRLLADLGVRATRVATAADGLRALEARPAGFPVAFVSVDCVDTAPFVDALAQHAAGARTTIVAVVPAGRRGGADLDRLASSHRLTRPLRRARLVECLDLVAAAGSPEGALSSSSPAVPSSQAVSGASALPEAPRPSAAPRVLVADDYFANQRLVTRLLERRGY